MTWISRYMLISRYVGLVSIAAAMLPLAARPAAADAGVSQARARQSVTRGLAYLRRIQETDGSWGRYPATTALAVCAFLQNGKSEVAEAATAHGVQFLLRSVKPNGGIYSDLDPATALPNYNTSLAVMALSLTRNPAYRNIINRAEKFIEKSQFDEGEGITSTNPIYGGIGYGSDPDDHPDLSNLQTALDALKAAGTPRTAPVWKKAILFIQRVQNREASNDQAWVRKGPNDGGFAYDTTGESKVKGAPHSSMGAMTYAGLKSYLYAGVSPSDPRAKAAWNWIRAHYTVAEHPGMGSTSLYYYYHTMAKTLDVYGQKIVRDTHGKPHDWAVDLATKITSVQHPDGSWFNTNARYWENQPSLVTSYSLIALSYCLK